MTTSAGTHHLHFSATCDHGEEWRSAGPEVYLYLAFAASPSLPHAAPSSLPTSPNVAFGFALTIPARSFLQNFMYADGAFFTLSLAAGLAAFFTVFLGLAAFLAGFLAAGLAMIVFW